MSTSETCIPMLMREASRSFLLSSSSIAMAVSPCNHVGHVVCPCLQMLFREVVSITNVLSHFGVHENVLRVFLQFREVPRVGPLSDAHDDFLQSFIHLVENINCLHIFVLTVPLLIFWCYYHCACDICKKKISKPTCMIMLSLLFIDLGARVAVRET